MFKLAVFGSKQRQEKFSLPESSTSPSSAFDTLQNFDFARSGSSIGIGESLTASPSHTTVHTDPYTAVQ
jgi:hypothetical protein